MSLDVSVWPGIRKGGSRWISGCYIRRRRLSVGIRQTYSVVIQWRGFLGAYQSLQPATNLRYILVLFFLTKDFVNRCVGFASVLYQTRALIAHLVCGSTSAVE